MAELLKNSYNEDFLKKVSYYINRHQAKFDSAYFVSHCLSDPWINLSLKQRMKKIASAFEHFISGNFIFKANLLTKVSAHFSSYPACVFPDFIEQYGLEHFKESMKFLELMTTYSTAEFAVRPFIDKYPLEMSNQMLKWSKHDNHHVRRLASEGCRPHLPWGKSLKCFKDNPATIIPILDNLKDDPSEYVRRSVANNLNDIGKDNCDILKQFINDNYQKVSLNCDKMLKHAGRNLLKSGDKAALQIFSYPNTGHIVIKNLKLSKDVDWGGNLCFSFDLISTRKNLGLIRIEYEISHLKKNGTYSSKVFKISETTLEKMNKFFIRKHSFKMRSVRKYYPGVHKLSIKLNGIVLQSNEFNLLPKS